MRKLIGLGIMFIDNNPIEEEIPVHLYKKIMIARKKFKAGKKKARKRSPVSSVGRACGF